MGTIAQVTHTRMRSIPARSSDRVSVKRLASSASFTAYASDPIAVAR